jgi:hypothetical protein
MFSRTTLYGYIAAAGYSLHEVVGLPVWAHNVTHLLVGISVALLGYYASDSRGPGNGRGPGPLLPMLVLSVGLLSGCQVAGLGVEVKSPTFGSVGIRIGGGSLGRPQAVSAGDLLCPPLDPEKLAPASPRAIPDDSGVSGPVPP